MTNYYKLESPSLIINANIHKVLVNFNRNLSHKTPVPHLPRNYFYRHNVSISLGIEHTAQTLAVSQKLSTQKYYDESPKIFKFQIRIRDVRLHAVCEHGTD